MIEGMVDPEWGRPGLQEAFTGLLMPREMLRFAKPYGQAWTTAFWSIEEWHWLHFLTNKLRRKGYPLKRPVVRALCAAARATFRVFPTEPTFTDRRSIEYILEAVELCEDWLRDELDDEGEGLLGSIATLLTDRHALDSPMGGLCKAVHHLSALVLSVDLYREEEHIGEAWWGLMRAQLPDLFRDRDRNGEGLRAKRWVCEVWRREMGCELIEAIEQDWRVYLGLEPNPYPVILKLSPLSVWPKTDSTPAAP